MPFLKLNLFLNNFAHVFFTIVVIQNFNNYFILKHVELIAVIYIKHRHSYDNIFYANNSIELEH